MGVVGPEIANEVLSWLRGAGDLVAQEAPLLARDIVRWHFWSAMFFVVGIGTLATLCWLLCATYIKSKSFSEGDKAAGGWVFGAGAVILSLVTLVNGAQCVKAAVAPRVVIVEQAKKLAE